MADTIIEEVLENTIVQDVLTSNIITVDATGTSVVETNTDSIVSSEVSSTTIVTEGIQGPAGPPTGISTDIDNLVFIGSGIGATKTQTSVYNNRIYESFGIGDELYLNWAAPSGLDVTKDISFEGTFFALSAGSSNTTSWEIHVTSHNHGIFVADGIVYANDLPLPDTAFEDQTGIATLDHTIYLDPTIKIFHIRLKRVASSNDPAGKVGVSDLVIHYNTDGKVGIQGPQGPSGDEDVPQAKKVDFITDDEMYIGEALPGTATSAASWRIKYVTIAGDGDVSVIWADGNDTYDNIWDNRLSLSYS